MEQRRLGPVVGLGTWNTFADDAARAREVVTAALDGRRQGTIVATKIWTSSVAEGRDQYRRQVEWFGRVEIEQIHNLVRWQEHLEWLEVEREAGNVDKVGVTHYAPGAFAAVAGALRTGSFDTVQLPYNPKEREARVDVAIPGTSSPARTAQNAAAGSPPWFGPDERRLVEGLAS